MGKLLTIGEPLVCFASLEQDITLKHVKRFEKVLAGAELNVAIGLTRLGEQVDYLSAVGTDIFGEFIIDELNRQRINSQSIVINKQWPTGFYLKQNVSHGDPQVAYFRKNSATACLTIDTLPEINYSKISYAHFTGIYAAISAEARNVMTHVMGMCQEENIPIVFDPNLRPSLWPSENEMLKQLDYFAKKATIVLPGISEGKRLMGSGDPEIIAKYYLSNEATNLVVVKLGEKGAYYQSKSGDEGFVEGFKVDNIVDTVGAGDGFATGLIAGLMNNIGLEAAVRQACAIGAMAVMSQGDSDGYPTRTELERFMAK